MRNRSALSGIRISLVVALVLTTFNAFMPAGANAAAQLSSTMVRLDNMHANQTSTGTVCVQPKTDATADPEDFILVKFPSQFTLSSTLSNWSTNTTQHPNNPSDLFWPSGAVAWPTALTATAVNTGTNTVTFQFGSATALATTSLYCFNWDTAAAITSVGAAGIDLQGSLETQDASNVAIDDGNFALTVVADNTITVSAVVPPIFEFTMPGTTDVFTANLSPTAVRTTSGVTPTIKTNAKGGWIMWAKDANQALNSTDSGGSIPSVGWNTDAPTTLTPGTPGYAMKVVKSVAGGTFCTESVAPEYDVATSGGHGGQFLANFEKIGDCTGGPSNGDGLTISEAATIAVTTPSATDYTDTIYVVGAGLF